MLQNIRQYTQGTTAKVVIGLVVISFAGFGVQSILLNGGGNEIAVVNGEKISPQELQVAVENQKRRLFAMYGNAIDPAMLEDERLASRSLEALINRKLLLQSGQTMGLTFSENELGAVIGNMEQFKVNGSFSTEQYKSLVSQAGFTPSSYKLSLRDDLILNQVSGGLAVSEFATSTELELSAKVIAEQRDFRYFTIPRERFAALPQVTEQQVEAYYNKHIDEFRTPESVDLEYIDLTPDDFFQPVDEGMLLEAYENAKQDLQYQTQYRVSHILFAPGGKTDVSERIAVVREKLSSGASFADVAGEFSDDAGSAGKGGDLGFTTGDTFPEEMEKVIAQLEPGIVSEPVETNEGTHLLLVTERKPANAPSFEEMRAKLEQGIQMEEAKTELIRVVELLKDLAFNADDLVKPAKELNLKLESQQSVTRNQATGLFANPELLEAAYSDEVFASGHNSDVIELPGDRFVVLRVSGHSPSKLLPLESARDSIVPVLESEALDAVLVAEGDRALVQLQSGVNIAEFAASQGYELVEELAVNRRNKAIPQDILRRVFELPPPAGGVASADVLVTPGGDATILQLERVTPGEYTKLTEAEQLNLRHSLTAEIGNLVFQEYQSGLRKRADINVL